MSLHLCMYVTSCAKITSVTMCNSYYCDVMWKITSVTMSPKLQLLLWRHVHIIDFFPWCRVHNITLLLITLLLLLLLLLLRTTTDAKVRPHFLPWCREHNITTCCHDVMCTTSQLLLWRHVQYLHYNCNCDVTAQKYNYNCDVMCTILQLLLWRRWRHEHLVSNDVVRRRTVHPHFKVGSPGFFIAFCHGIFQTIFHYNC
jgi:hypothetical protein